MTKAQELADMSSHANRKLYASAASRTRFIPARKAGKNGRTRAGSFSCRPYPSPYTLAPVAPTFTMVRKAAVSESSPRCAPSHGKLSGRTALVGGAAIDDSATTLSTDESTAHAP